MPQHDDRGMATSEYAVGTLGVAMIAMVLYRLGVLDDHNPWMEAFRELLDRSLGGWGKLREFIPGLGLRAG